MNQSTQILRGAIERMNARLAPAKPLTFTEIPFQRFPRINTPNTKHLYEMGVFMNGHRAGTVEIEANNRTQAASIAIKAGYVVADCNMVG